MKSPRGYSYELIDFRARLRVVPANTIHRFSDLLEVDADRVRLWLLVRAAAEPRDDWKGDPLTPIARAVDP